LIYPGESVLAIRKVSPGFGGLSVDEVSIPTQVTGNQVLLKVEAAGICGTDLLIYKWAISPSA